MGGDRIYIRSTRRAEVTRTRVLRCLKLYAIGGLFILLSGPWLNKSILLGDTVPSLFETQKIKTGPDVLSVLSKR